jgi:hypothetical protein
MSHACSAAKLTRSSPPIISFPEDSILARLQRWKEVEGVLGTRPELNQEGWVVGTLLRPLGCAVNGLNPHSWLLRFYQSRNGGSLSGGRSSKAENSDAKFAPRSGPTLGSEMWKGATSPTSLRDLLFHQRERCNKKSVRKPVDNTPNRLRLPGTRQLAKAEEPVIWPPFNFINDSGLHFTLSPFTIHHSPTHFAPLTPFFSSPPTPPCIDRDFVIHSSSQTCLTLVLAFLRRADSQTQPLEPLSSIPCYSERFISSIRKGA